jgi:hypothetical protein
MGAVGPVFTAFSETKTMTKPAVKFLDCLFVGIAVVDFYDSLVMFPVFFFSGKSVMLIPSLINFLLTVAAVVFAIGYPILWHRRETHSKANSPLIHAWLTGIIRYWLAGVILNYGFAKIFGTQFATNYFRGDSTWNSLSGYDLTWNYFGYSYAMSIIIAFIQIAGCIFLFFRRTTILGILLLLPVMVNVSLIDIFFGIAGGATGNAVLFTLALAYLLGLQWPAIRVFFQQSQSKLPRIRFSGMKNLLRLALTAWAFVFIALVASTKGPAGLTGKWRVDQLIRNGRTAAPNDWLSDSLSWKFIYVEKFSRVTFSPNPYVVEHGRATIGTYKYDQSRHSIRFTIFHQPANDTATAELTGETSGHMQWTLVDHADTVSLSLTKVSAD